MTSALHRWITWLWAISDDIGISIHYVQRAYWTRETLTHGDQHHVAYDKR